VDYGLHWYWCYGLRYRSRYAYGFRFTYDAPNGRAYLGHRSSFVLPFPDSTLHAFASAMGLAYHKQGHGPGIPNKEGEGSVELPSRYA
jgi:hypothetical protein